VSTWQFLVNYGSGEIDLADYSGRSLVPRESIDLDRQTHNGGKSVISTLSFELSDPPAALVSDLYQVPTYQLVPITVLRDSAYYFTGYLRPVDSYEAGASDSGTVERRISIEAVDVLWKLQRTLTESYVMNATSVDTIVRDLLAEAGFTSDDLDFYTTLSQVLLVIYEKPNDREIREILDDLLYEYHHCLRATADGKIELFDWLDDGSTAVGSFNESIDKISAEKTDEDYGYVTVEYLYYGSLDVQNRAISAQRARPSGFSNWTTSANPSATVRLDSNLDEGVKVVGIEDATLYIRPWWNSANFYAFDKVTGFGETLDVIPVDGRRWTAWYRNPPNQFYGLIEFAATFNQDRGTIEIQAWRSAYYHNPDGSILANWTTTIAFVDVFVYAKIYYQRVAGEGQAKTSSAGVLNARTERYEGKHVYSLEDAQALAAAILQLRQYGSRQWRVRSHNYVKEGSIVNVVAGPMDLTVRGRILRLEESQRNTTTDGLAEYSYIIESLETSESIDNSYPESEPNIPVLPIDADAIPRYEDLINGIDEVGQITELPAPALAVSSTTRKASLAVGIVSSLVSGSFACEFQISDNDTDWFSLGPGGNNADAWKDQADEVTRVNGTSYTHDQLPLNGDAGNPLQTTYYYRARVVSGAVVSEWSDSQSVVVSPVLEGDLGADSVTAQKIAADSVTAEKINVTDLQAIGATIAGWQILASMLASDDDTVRIRRDKKRFEILDTLGNVKAAFGFLDGIDGLGVNDYGLWIASGNVIRIEGGGSFDAGDYNIQEDGAFVVLDTNGDEIVRLGSLGFGNVGAKIGDPLNGQGLSYETSTGTLTVAGKIIVKDIVIDEEDGISGLSADRQRRLEISSEKIDFYEIQDGTELQTASISDRTDSRPVRFTKHIRVGGEAVTLPAGTVAYYSCDGGVPIGAREGGTIELTDDGMQIDNYTTSRSRIANHSIVMGG
jgi:membrane protein implicated in regulation of membrane protease activity